MKLEVEMKISGFEEVESLIEKARAQMTELNKTMNRMSYAIQTLDAAVGLPVEETKQTNQ